jgi:transcription antitermination factor NusG
MNNKNAGNRNDFLAGWYLIYTKPRHERKVHARLSEMNIRSFLPTRKVLRNWHDRKKYIDEPLFPSYVFIYLEDRQNYYNGMETEGYLCYVRSGKTCARVSESIIDNIRLIAGRQEEIDISDRHFQPGRKLVINQGPLAGLNCELVEFSGRQKALVRVDLLQRNILLTLSSEYLMTH